VRATTSGARKTVLAVQQICGELTDERSELLAPIASDGFRNVRECGPAGICATRSLLFSGGLFTGLTLDGVRRSLLLRDRG
jgi:hypothetical protein